MDNPDSAVIGPILILDDVSGGRCRLSALFIAPADARLPPIRAGGRDHAATRLWTAGTGDEAVFRIRFDAPADGTGGYAWDGRAFELATDLTGDLRLAFVSCNGEEHGDLARDGAERNAMWARLGARHRETPFALLLHGGDQIYADEATHGHPLSEGWPGRLPEAPAEADLAGLRDHLRARFFERYRAVYAAPEAGWLMARVPSLMQWDDHDICDGWGSLSADRLASPVGRVLFSVAREMALLFQHAAVEGDLPARFADPAGGHLGWAVEAPGLRLVAPDLRSERTPTRIMGPAGWAFVEGAMRGAGASRVLMLSSVPLLGPRLSILETLMVLAPGMQKYEDDLRDQWQSRAHRAEWRRMLALLREVATEKGTAVAALSGEIHLAARAEMALAPAGGGDDGPGGDAAVGAPGTGAAVLHQLVASGIAHRAPPVAWARALGAIAMLGDAPLEGHPIAIRPLPGQAGRYVAERNFLTVTRRDGAWQAEWDLERSGRTGALAL